MNRAMALANGFGMGNSFKDVLFRRADSLGQAQVVGQVRRDGTR